MARGARSSPLLLALALVGALAWCTLGGQSAGAAFTAANAQQQIAGQILSLAKFVAQMCLSLLPGAVVAIVGYSAYARRETMTKRGWAGLSALLVLGLVAWSASVVMRSGSAPASQESSQAMVPTPHSGEIRVINGELVKLPDPTLKPGAPIKEGWQKNLAREMTDAIKSGKEQVVLLFSRQGCPWCERQLPVIGQVIAARTQAIEAAKPAAAQAAPAGAACGTAFVGGGAVMAPGGLGLAPLRIFLLDASEFPYLMQQFRIQAFPTSLTFGMPGATPIMAQGFLNQEQFEDVLSQAASARPEEPGAQGGRQTRRKRRGLFR